MREGEKTTYKVLKLKDGTNIIGKVVGGDASGMIVDIPMIYELGPVFDTKGRIKYFTISFRKWFEFAVSQRYYFPKEYIIAHSEPEKDLIRDYIRAKRANSKFQRMKDKEEFTQGVVEEKEDVSELDMNIVEDIMNKIMDDIMRGSSGSPSKNAQEGKWENSLERGGTNDGFWRGFPIL